LPGRGPLALLTVVTKSNAQRQALLIRDEIAAEVDAEFPNVTSDKMLVDAMTMRMVMKPQTLDTIVATNLHADILSDLAETERLMKAVEHVTADPSLHTPDLGGKATTKQVSDAFCAALWQANERAMAGNGPKLPSSQGRSRSPQTSHNPLRRAPRRECSYRAYSVPDRAAAIRRYKLGLVPSDIRFFLRLDAR
jgi:hypothetical protein